MKTWDDWSDKEVSDGVAKIVGTYSEFCSTHDYCNSWADMGPLIENKQLWLQPDMVGDGNWRCYDLDDNHSAKHHKPTMAAAIVFLMMNGVKP